MKLIILNVKKNIMNEKKKLNMIKICEQVSQDVKNDARKFDGKPFNGRTMAEYMGNHGAAIKALSDILTELLKEKL